MNFLNIGLHRKKNVFQRVNVEISNFYSFVSIMRAIYEEDLDTASSNTHSCNERTIWLGCFVGKPQAEETPTK
jgi:hypothetical protein